MEKFNYEIKMLKFWEENEIYKKLNEKNKSGELFVHIDGPPYPTGEPHLGHIRNWAIKDCVLRFKRFLGYNVYARFGYDVHGLPVEIKVQQKLNLKDIDELKKFGEENFILECKKYVSNIIDNMQEKRKRFALWMNDNYYSTSHPEYLSMAWRFFKKADEKGLLYKDKKVVAWSPGAQTTLSDYEIKDSYTILKDPSIYVKFELLKNLWEDENVPESILIWTTTPWTLQSNLAAAMNPNFDYSRILVEVNNKKEVFIIATNLIDEVLNSISKTTPIKKIKVLETKKGLDFEGIKYKHILFEETPSQQEFAKLNNPHIHSIVMAEFVTLGEEENIVDKLAKKSSKHTLQKSNENEIKKENENLNNNKKSSGTGIVHIAPGHGFDDFEIGKKYDLPLYSPVDSKAIIEEGKFKGLYFKDADPIIINYLKKKGNLLHSEIKSHKYPLCWRTKVPIIYRAVEQWWIKRTKLIDSMIKENSNVKWFPSFAKENFNNLLKGVTDWPISRQRFCGIPLPIFEDEDGNYEVFGSKEELEERIGKKLKDIHRNEIKNLEIRNKKNGKIMKPVPYTADVWFDSGCASFASHYGEGLNFDEIIQKYYPINWITEGEDQIRGWFSSLFNVGYLLTSKRPYNQVLFYGFVMAKDGTKMSKSLGNGIDGNEAIEKFGADATRYYLLTKSAPENKLNFDIDEFTEVFGFFNTLENVFKFSNNYLNEHKIKEEFLPIDMLEREDFWILYKLNLTIRNYKINLENYKINSAIKYVEEFIIKDFSKVYLKLIKDRTNKRDDALLSVLVQILRRILIMLSVAIPFKCEYLYQKLNINNKKESLFLENFRDEDEFIIKKGDLDEIENNFNLTQDVIGAILNAREKVKIGIRWPLFEVNIVGENLENKLKPFEKLIKTLTNIVNIKYSLEDINLSYNIKPNFKEIKEDFTNLSEIIKIINSSKTQISDAINNNKKHIKLNNINIDLDKHIIKEMILEDKELVSSSFKNGIIILHTHQDEVLLEQGYIRELVRRVQDKRKNENMNKKEKIIISFRGSDKYYENLIKNAQNNIKEKVGANEILFDKDFENKEEFIIKGKKLSVSFLPL